MLRLSCVHRPWEGAQAVALLWKVSASQVKAAVPNSNSLALHADSGQRQAGVDDLWSCRGTGDTLVNSG